MKYADWLTPDNLIRVSGWVRDGLSQEQVAHNIGISKATLYEWIKKYPDFSDAIKKSREVVDYEVENALFKSATGFWEGGKYYPPVPASLIFWLKNRKPELWKDKVVNAQEIDVEDLTPLIEKLK